MATSKKISQKDVVPSEIGSTGVYTNQANLYYNESLRELTFPMSLSTYDKMSQDVTIASALNAVNVIASRVPVYLEPFDQSDTHKKRALFVEQCFKDMDGDTLDSIIQKALTFNKYGFAVLEKVFRRRRHKYGSKYDDGKIGLKYLPIRKQHSIVEFKWDDNYRQVEGLYQSVTPRTNYSYMLDGNNRVHIDLSNKVNKDGLTFIKRDSFLLFKADLSSDLPESVSPLAACYKAWRELQSLKDLESIAASKNMNGILVGSIPAEYLAADADDDMKKAAQAFKDGLSKITINQQGSILMPSTRDETSGGKEWEITTLQSSSSHVTSITAIITNIKNQILQCLFADTLQTGDVVAAAASNKKSMLNMLVETRIREILRIINTDLIPELFRRNGWDDSKVPQFKYGELEEIDMAVFAKGMQQLRATRLVPLTPKNVNYIAEVMGLPDRLSEDLTQDELEKLLGVEQTLDSNSGLGYSSDTGGLNGTGNDVSEEDNSASNLSNV